MKAEADWDHLGTPETYLGYGHSRHFASQDSAYGERSTYEQLAPEHDEVRERTLEITFQKSGAEAYAFTFG